jgi:hypothetical protein
LLLDRHGQPEQRAALATTQRSVGGIGSHARPIEVAHDHRINLRVERLDACDCGVH